MSLNRKLTPILLGRIIQSAQFQDTLLEIHFTDDSILRIKTAAPADVQHLPGQVLKRIRQRGTQMLLDFTDDTTFDVTLAEAMSSVMLRDQQGVMEYAD